MHTVFKWKDSLSIVFSLALPGLMNFLGVHKMARGEISLATFTAAPILFISFIRPASLYCEESVYVHIPDCVQTVYELALLSNNTAVKHF